VLKDTRLAFIGTGVMGEAMIRGLLAHDLVAPEAITASHPRRERLEELAAQFRIETTRDNRKAVEGAGIVTLSVKPQVLPAVLGDLRGRIPKRAFVLSIVAGARIATIVKGLEHRAVVRCMPNTPAQVGEGMTVWTATPAVGSRQRAQAQAVLGALGKDLHVEEEGFLDMATAVSGTGPTYVFMLMEALIDAAVHLGFSRADARALVVQTLRGAALFAEQSRAHPAELRNMVTSPGGTSAAAVYQLEKGGLRTVLSKAVWAAYQRSMTLGQKQPGPSDPNAEETPAAEDAAGDAAPE